MAVKTRISKVFEKQFGFEASNVIESYSLSGDLHLDSLDMIELQMSLEEEFNFVIKDSLWHNVETVKDVCGLVESLSKEKYDEYKKLTPRDKFEKLVELEERIEKLESINVGKK